MVRIADRSDRGSAIRRNTSNFSTRQIDLCPIGFPCSQHRAGARRPAKHAATTRLQFDIVDCHSQRHIPQRQAIADRRCSICPTENLHADFQALGGEDVTLFTVNVMQQCDPCRTVRVVVNRVDLRRNSILVAAEIDESVTLFVPSAAVPCGNFSLIIPTPRLRFTFEQLLG